MALPEVLLDPNKFRRTAPRVWDQLRSRRTESIWPMAFRKGGSDWNDVYVLDTWRQSSYQADHVEWMKSSGISWQGDGFYYSRYPAPEKGHELTAKNENHQVFYHKIGTPQSADTLVYEDPANPQRFHTVSTSDDERYAVPDDFRAR